MHATDFQAGPADGDAPAPATTISQTCPDARIHRLEEESGPVREGKLVIPSRRRPPLFCLIEVRFRHVAAPVRLGIEVRWTPTRATVVLVVGHLIGLLGNDRLDALAA